MASTLSRQMVPKIYGVLPSLAFDDDIQVHLRPSKALLSDLSSLPAGSVIGMGIPFYDNGWVYKGAGGAVRKKAMPYWDSVIGMLRRAGMRLEFLVPPTLKDAEIKHALKATSPDPYIEFKHSAIKDYIYSVTVPNRIERSIAEIRPAALLCSQQHAHILAARTGLPYLEETHKMEYLIESYIFLRNDNARHNAQHASMEGWKPDSKGDKPDDMTVSESDAPSVFVDIGAELSMEAEENGLNRLPSLPADVLFMQEMCGRRYKAANTHRVTDCVPSHIGTCSPALPALGIFELHVTTNARGEVRGTLEDVVGTARVKGRIRDGIVKLSVRYAPERCIRDEHFSEVYQGEWHDGRYVGTWQIEGTQRRGDFTLVSCEDILSQDE